MDDDLISDSGVWMGAGNGVEVKMESVYIAREFPYELNVREARNLGTGRIGFVGEISIRGIMQNRTEICPSKEEAKEKGLKLLAENASGYI